MLRAGWTCRCRARSCTAQRTVAPPSTCLLVPDMPTSSSFSPHARVGEPSAAVIRVCHWKALQIFIHQSSHKLTAYRPYQIKTRQPGRACNQLLVLHSDSESIHEKWSYNALSPCGKHRTNGLLKQYAAKGCNPHELLDCTIAYPL